MNDLGKDSKKSPNELAPIYGLLVGIFLAVLYLALYVVPTQSARNRNIVLYCVRENVIAIVHRVPLPAECLGAK